MNRVKVAGQTGVAEPRSTGCLKPADFLQSLRLSSLSSPVLSPGFTSLQGDVGVDLSHESLVAYFQARRQSLREPSSVLIRIEFG